MTRTDDTDRNRCVFCGRPDGTDCYPTRSIFGDQFRIVRCSDCGAYSLAPAPTEQQLSQAYDSSYYGEREEKFNPLVEKALDLFRDLRSAYLRRRLSPGARLLDVGCGNGRFLKFLSRRASFELHGIELPGNSAERASRIPSIRLKVGTLKPGDYPKGYFDAVTLFHVFEHLPDPAGTIATITEILKPGGWLVMSFPNIASWQSRLFRGDWLHLDPPRHLFFFEPGDLARHLAPKGFRLVRSSYWSPEQNPFGAVQSLLNRWNPERDLLFEALKGNRAYYAGVPRGRILLNGLFFVLSFGWFVLTDAMASLARKGATVEMTFRKDG
jgi:SAM-dependent methyltransferase